MTRIWEWFKANLGSTVDAVVVGVGIFVVVLDVFGITDQTVVQGATLALLALVGGSLLAHNRERLTLQKSIDGANSLLYGKILDNSENLIQAQREIEKSLKQLQKPSVSAVFATYGEYVRDIEQRLWLAREVWILSRTGSRLWSDFHDQFVQLLSKSDGNVRLLVVDPNNGAMQMIVKTAEGWASHHNFELWRAMHLDFLSRMQHQCEQSNSNGLFIRTIEYLPAWTLILIDPSSDQGVIYVELAACRRD